MGSDNTWVVGQHDAIEKLEGDLWRVEGAIEGMQLRRVMALAKIADGGIVVHNAIALEEAAMQEIEGWGTPRYIVVPNAYHRIDCGRFKRRYPDAKVVCPKAARKRVSEVARVDLTFDEFPSDERVTVRHIDGTADSEGVMIVRHAAGDGTTLVFNDLVFNMPHIGGGIGFVLRHLTRSTGGPTVSRIARWLVIKDKQRVAKDLEVLAQTPGLRRIIVSHHQTIETDAAETLLRLAASLK